MVFLILDQHSKGTGKVGGGWQVAKIRKGLFVVSS